MRWGASPMTTRDGQHAIEKTYRIERFFADDRPSETVVRGLTLEQAQAHCDRDDTQGDDWFDGYYEET